MGRNLVNENGKYAVQSSVDDETILTPWFDDKEGVIQHLIKHGDDHNKTPVPEEYARKFVEIEHAPSMVLTSAGLLVNYWTMKALG